MHVIESNQEGNDEQEDERRHKLDQGCLPNADLPFWIYPATSVVNLVRKSVAEGYSKESSAEYASYEFTKDVNDCSNGMAVSGKCHGYRHHRVDQCARC